MFLHDVLDEGKNHEEMLAEFGWDGIVTASQEHICKSALKDQEFLNRFANNVARAEMDALIVLPRIAEQAFVSEMWNAYENGLYNYDPEAEGNFADYLDSIMQWTDPDAPPSVKSDIKFMVETMFPFLKANKQAVVPLIKNYSKTRSAVPALRVVYAQLMENVINKKEAIEKIGGIINEVADPKINTKALNESLKKQGLKATRNDPYQTSDWPQDNQGGMLMVRYPNLGARTRLLNRLDALIDKEHVGLFTDKVDSLTHYAIWAGRAVGVLISSPTDGVSINPAWDGKGETVICWGDTAEIGKVARQKLYAAGFTAERSGDGYMVTLSWEKKDTPVVDPFEEDELLF